MDARNQDDKPNLPRGKRVLLGLLLCLVLLLILAVCALLIRLLIRQGQDVDISVDTSGDRYTERVTVTVKNVLGMDVLLPESDQSCALLQAYDSKDGEWKDVCEIRFLQTDQSVLSFKYGGMFIHLSPGGELQAQIPEDRLDALASGEYRVAVRYITEDAYNSYLQKRAEQIEKELQNESIAPAESSSDAAETSDVSGMQDTSEAEEDGATMQWFYTSFYLTARKDASENVSPHVDVSIELE